MPLCSVKNVFLPFSRFLDFSEGYLSFERGMKKPVKVLDVTKVGHPHPITLPGIKPMMSIAVSSRALFVLAVRGGRYFLWKKKETQPNVYDVFVMFDLAETFLRRNQVLMGNEFYFRECCFTNDCKFAVVLSTAFKSHSTVFVIDVDTRFTARCNIENKRPSVSTLEQKKVLCTDTVMIRLTPNVIEIFDLKTWKRLDVSFQRYLCKDFVVHSKLSPEGTVLAVPRLTGDMEFFQLHIAE